MIHPAEVSHLPVEVQPATVVTDANEQRRVFNDPSSTWYLQQGVDLEILVAVAPMVRVDFVS